MTAYKDNHGIVAKPAPPPENNCMIGMVPWIEFEHYSPVPYAQSDCFFPVIQAGKYTMHEDRLWMPYSFTCHHAVADGYYISEFLDGVQAQFANPHLWIYK